MSSRARRVLAVVAIGCWPLATAVSASDPAPDPQPETEVEATVTKRTSRLQGRAYVDRRTNVVGATVVARPMGDAGRVFLTSTDERGVFRIEGLTDGQYELRIERAGMEPVVKEEVPVRFPFRAVVELMMRPADGGVSRPSPETAPPSTAGELRLTGTLWDAEQSPVNEADLRLVRADGAADPHILRTGEDGAIAFEALAPGRWLLIVRSVGMLPIRAELDLREETAIEIALVRQPASYEPSPIELMPPEEPVAPAVFTEGYRAADREAAAGAGRARSLDPDGTSDDL